MRLVGIWEWDMDSDGYSWRVIGVRQLSYDVYKNAKSKLLHV